MTKQLDFHSLALQERLGKKNQWLTLRDKVSWERLASILKETDETGALGGKTALQYYDHV